MYGKIFYLASLLGAFPQDVLGSGGRWQVELSSKPGTCLSGITTDTQVPESRQAVHLSLAPCQPSDLRQQFQFVGPSGKVKWAAQPHLCLDEEAAGIVPCLPDQDNSRQQIFAFNAKNGLLISGRRPNSCLRVSQVGTVLNPCDSTDPWQHFRVTPAADVDAVSMVTSAAGKLMRTSNHRQNFTHTTQVMHEKKLTSGWAVNKNTRKGGIMIYSASNQKRCLKGPPANQDHSKVVNTGKCSTDYLRYFFHWKKGLHQLRFCHPSTTEKGASESFCRWDMCLQADSASHAATVRRVNCSSSSTLQKWDMTPAYDVHNAGHKYIKLKGESAYCLKLYMHSPYKLQMRTCTTNTTGWQKKWVMPWPHS